MSIRANTPAPTASQMASRLDKVLRIGQACRVTTVCATFSQDVSAPFHKIQYDYTETKLKKEDERYTILTTRQPLEGITKHDKTGRRDPSAAVHQRQLNSSTRLLVIRRNHKKALQYWLDQDFSDTPMPTSNNMFDETSDFKALKQLAGKDAPDTLIEDGGYGIFEPAWNEWYLEKPTTNPEDESRYVKANLRSQTVLLDATYKKYVDVNTNSKIVQMWTSEMDVKKGNVPPHKKMEHFLLLKALNYLATREGVWNQVDKIKKLYDLVTGAPRCPDMMSFIRVVRNSTRLPQFWFKLKHKRKMMEGESIVLPVFMSTSNIDMDSSWFSQGPGSAASNVDSFDNVEPAALEEESEVDCCFVQVIVSKGTPMLPLGDFKSNNHQHENEILLPPGIELVLVSLGEEATVNRADVTIHTFITRVRG